MALAAFATKLSGALFMQRLPPSPTLERLLEGMAAAVIAAIVASAAMTADARSLLAVAAAALTMALTRRMVLSLLVGMAVSAGLGLLRIDPGIVGWWRPGKG